MMKLKNLFESARLRLTLWYTLALLIISLIISALFYFRSMNVIKLEFNRIERRIHKQYEGTISSNNQGLGRINRPQVLAEDIARARHRIILQLVMINSLVVVFFAGLGYFLAGETLQPIEQAMQKQKRFVSDAAHELKTPITALKTALEVSLLNQDLDQNCVQILKDNLEKVEDLQTLSAGLLNLSKQDDIKIEFELFKVAALVKQAVSQIKPLADKKQIKIETQLDSDIAIKADQLSFKKLLVILLDNAVKYSSNKSKVTLKVETKGKKFSLAVKDEGIGIAQEEIPHIFDRFYQADSSRASGQEDGYGLGLSLAKKIVEQHQGDIVVKSELGQGTSFEVTVPGLV